MCTCVDAVCFDERAEVGEVAHLAGIFVPADTSSGRAPRIGFELPGAEGDLLLVALNSNTSHDLVATFSTSGRGATRLVTTIR